MGSTAKLPILKSKVQTGPESDEDRQNGRPEAGRIVGIRFFSPVVREGLRTDQIGVRTRTRFSAVSAACPRRISPPTLGKTTVEVTRLFVSQFFFLPPYLVPVFPRWADKAAKYVRTNAKSTGGPNSGDKSWYSKFSAPRESLYTKFSAPMDSVAPRRQFQ